MKIEKPAFTTYEIEQMRIKLEKIISLYGLNSSIALQTSQCLDRLIFRTVKK